MAAKPIFTDDQVDIIRATARKVFKGKFEWMKADKKAKQLGGQEAMALALGVTQQTVSNLLSQRKKYAPGLKVATAIANLDGQTLEQMIGEFGSPSAPESSPSSAQRGGSFANLDTCIGFHAHTKHWSPWTIAAARAGFFGTNDFPPPEWTTKLDSLERALERAKKAS